MAILETESSYGMGVEGESPILLPWQHNKSSCLHEASGFGTGSNESGASSDISSKYKILIFNKLRFFNNLD